MNIYINIIKKKKKLWITKKTMNMKITRAHQKMNKKIIY